MSEEKTEVVIIRGMTPQIQKPTRQDLFGELRKINRSTRLTGKQK